MPCAALSSMAYVHVLPVAIDWPHCARGWHVPFSTSSTIHPASASLCALPSSPACPLDTARPVHSHGRSATWCTTVQGVGGGRRGGQAWARYRCLWSPLDTAA